MKPQIAYLRDRESAFNDRPTLSSNHIDHSIANASSLLRHTDDDLLTRRRLGKTNLMVKPEQLNTSNATKKENLGTFEYAHLRAPLPKDLKGSEIFPSHNSQQHPETYFLMVWIARTPQTISHPTNRVPSGLIAEEQGWLCQRNWHVQDCIPMGQG